jgi:hypothetical protein
MRLRRSRRVCYPRAMTAWDLDAARRAALALDGGQGAGAGDGAGDGAGAGESSGESSGDGAGDGLGQGQDGGSGAWLPGRAGLALGDLDSIQVDTPQAPSLTCPLCGDVAPACECTELARWTVADARTEWLATFTAAVLHAHNRQLLQIPRRISNMLRRDSALDALHYGDLLEAVYTALQSLGYNYAQRASGVYVYDESGRMVTEIIEPNERPNGD